MLVEPTESTPSASSATPNIVHNPNSLHEVMHTFLTGDKAGLTDIIIDYFGGDADSLQQEKPIEKLSAVARQNTTLFGHNVLELMAFRVANLTLLADENSVEEALNIVKENPSLLGYVVTVTDQHGNTVQGKPLQIAAMAGDLDVLEDVKVEIDNGMVERLAVAGGLSNEEVAQQLHVINSAEAKQENEKRKKIILEKMIWFGNSIAEVRSAPDIGLRDFRENCKEIINALKQALKSDPTQIITSGYIFDPRIICDVVKWFKDNIAKFDNYYSLQSEIFCINGIGKLQRKFSARDLQTISAGIGNVIDYKRTPPRTHIKNEDIEKIGELYYVGFSGLKLNDNTMTDLIAPMVAKKPGWLVEAWMGLDSLMLHKENSINNMINLPRARI
jgi:hypothetical protein